MELNTEADIYVNTVYNPFHFSHALHQFADPFIQQLNAKIKEYESVYGYKVVDVYTKFEDYKNPRQLAVGDLSNLAEYTDPQYVGPVPLHPTDMGYKLIYNLHKDLIE